MSRRFSWWRGLSRVVTRPRPWVLRYLLHLLPAVLLAVPIAVSMLGLFRYPLMTEALRTRSLGDLLEITRTLDGGGSNARLAALGRVAAFGLALFAWLPVQVAGLWLEGGVLHTYAADHPPDGRAFRSACKRTFGSFLVLAAGQSLVIGLVAVVAVALGAALDRPLILGISAGFAVVGLMVLGELARVSVVVAEDRHAVRALRNALRLAGNRLGGLALLAGASIGLQVLLFSAQRAAGRAIPIPWWALSLFVLQGIQFLGAGVRLARQAGMVGLAQGEGSDG